MTLRAFQCFAAGRHTTMNGEVVTFSDNELHGIAVDYDPKLSAAPLVLGHPANNRPRYGDVKGLTAHGSALFCVAYVDDELIKLVRANRYRAVSSSFFLPGAPDNPRSSNRYYLSHIGFLGAVPPAVKSMQPLAFAETVDFPQKGNTTLSGKHRNGVVRSRVALCDVAQDLQRVCPGLSFIQAAAAAERALRW